MPINATITAKVGPNRQATTVQLNEQAGIAILPDKKILQVLKSRDTNSPPQQEFDLTGVTTITITIAGAYYNVTVS